MPISELTAISKCSSGTASSARIWTDASSLTVSVPLLTATIQSNCIWNTLENRSERNQYLSYGRYVTKNIIDTTEHCVLHAPKNVFMSPLSSFTVSLPGFRTASVGTWVGKIPIALFDPWTSTCCTSTLLYHSYKHTHMYIYVKASSLGLRVRGSKSTMGGNSLVTEIAFL